ncbi:uncharacterized protein LOC128671250 [Plodia interpunctella]|uniref:uncharacterized protein LOC128671250 n=1 Tax=Plodia interpunctella TaxID=58824 RepID=UPI002367A916|nr:uncharacterized protein LOC128671250 [Plodia interpunctella]
MWRVAQRGYLVPSRSLPMISTWKHAWLRSVVPVTHNRLQGYATLWRISVRRVLWTEGHRVLSRFQFQNYHKITMKDDRRVIMEFCKIVQRFPELYDHSSDTYRRWCAENAWEKVADCVRNELHEECTVEELKMKWKGIRSSYNRYKNRVFKSKFGSKPFKDYYLHKTLQFLDPFIKPKGVISNASEAQIVFEDCYDQSMLDENDSSTWAEVDVDIKPVVLQNNTEKDEATTSNDTNNTKTKKRKRDDDDTDEENEDMQFFRSILPDIKDFTSKEKRKLKMSILKAIDEIENERKNS